MTDRLTGAARRPDRGGVRLRLRPAATLALVALVGGCGDPPPSAVRLVEAGETASARLAPLRAKLPIELLDADYGLTKTPLAPRRLVMLRGEYGKDHRQALLAPTPSDYRFELRLPDDQPVLETAIGYLMQSELTGEQLTFAVRIIPGSGSGETVFEESLQTNIVDGWRDRRIPLDRWAGESVVLELSTRDGGADRPQQMAAWAAPRIRSGGPPAASRPNLVMISLDTLRADRLGSYGYERPTSPHLDAFAARSVRFETAISQSTWTRPSHESIFSGLYPISKGGLTSPLLAGLLWQAGYNTAAVTSGGQVDPAFGFAHGFERYVTEYYWLEQPELAIDWLRGEPAEPFFLFLHTYETHSPYTRDGLAGQLDPGRAEPGFNSKQRKRLRKISPTEKLYINALYDSGIQFADQQIGAVLNAMEHLGLLETTIVVIFSDHGETLWDHGGWGHGRKPFEHQIRVPLIVHLPESVRRERDLGRLRPVVRQPVELLDLYPTIGQLLDLDYDHPVQGSSLLPVMRGERRKARDTLSEATKGGLESKALRTERYKLISAYRKRAEPPLESVRQWLYDLANDPLEKHDLAAELPELAAALQLQLDRRLSDRDAGEFDEGDLENLDPELRRQLEALGYLGK